MSSKKKSEAGNKKTGRVELSLQELTEDLKRVQADFVNYKRRQDEERPGLMDFAKQNVVEQILPVFDNIDRALAHLPKELENNDWAKGVKQVAKQSEDTLKELGVQKIKAKGEVFNPELHEAIGFEEGEGEHEIVVEELRPGYKIGGTVIRPSIVKVGKVK